jgi:hypothetical protein
MKRFIVSVGCAAAILVAANVALAQGKGGGPKPKPTTGASAKVGGSAAHGGSATHAGVKTHGGGPKAVQGGAKTHGSTMKTAHGGPTKTTLPTAKGPKVKTTVADGTSASGTKTKKTTTIATTTPTGTLTPVQQKLLRNTNLASKLESRLPAGTDLMAASEGFRNLGQFVAAVNVSNNLGIDFLKLKTAMVDDGMSLGQAIQSQRSSVDATVEASRAQRDADTLIRSSDVTTSTTSTSSTKKAVKVKSSKSDRR